MNTIRPEELVRQAYLKYLKEQVGVPPSLIEVECGLARFEAGNRKRCDIVVVKPAPGIGVTPWLLCECKAPNIVLGEAQALQIANYLSVLRVEFVVLTNGKKTLCFCLEGNKYINIPSLPRFNLNA